MDSATCPTVSSSTIVYIGTFAVVQQDMYCHCTFVAAPLSLGRQFLMPVQRCLLQGGLYCQTVLASYLRVLLCWLQLASLLMFEAFP